MTKHVLKSEFFWNLLILLCSIIIALSLVDQELMLFEKSWWKSLGSSVAIVMLIGNFILRLISTWKKGKNEELTKFIHEYTLKKKAEEEIDRRYEGFLAFLKSENQYDFLFVDLGKNGLAYNLSPVRETDGELKIYKDDTRLLYVVKVNEISHRQVLSEERIEEYESSPIKVSEYYFCVFINGYWHLQEDTFSDTPYKIIKYGKVGKVRNTLSANNFINPKNLANNHTLVTSFLIDENGLVNNESGDIVNIYGHLNEYFIEISKSPLKRIYLRNKKNEYGPNCNWFLEIEYFDGYMYGSKLSNFKDTLFKQLTQNSINLKKLEWYKISRELNA